MIRRPVGVVLQCAADWVDDSIPEQKIRTWFLEQWRQCALRSWHASGEDAAVVDAVLEEAAQAASRAGLLPAPPERPGNLPALPSAARLAAAERWAADASKRAIVRNGRILPGTGRWLDLLAVLPRHAQLVADAFETLLRHVEVRRQSALMLEHPSCDDRLQWVEKHEVAVALSRHTLRTDDFRWLNAAFKLNDWAFPAHRRLRPSLQLAHYLRAVAEQEAAAARLCA